MKAATKYLLVFAGFVSILYSCAMSMSPVKVNNTLPNLTESNFIPQTVAVKLIETNKCTYLVEGRNYTAPIGLTVKGDLKNGALGIDEWVQLDGGNSYVLRNFKWITVDGDGSTQLHLEFDTMLCE